MSRKTFAKTSVPKTNSKTSGTLPITKANAAKDDRFKFSFVFLDLEHEYFNLGGTCMKWYRTLLGRLSDMSQKNLNEMKACPTYRFHSHDMEKIEFKPSSYDQQLDFYQISLGKGLGRIHGYLIDGMFYVVWLDRHHNLYPDKKHGGLKKFDEPETCCGYNEDLENENRKLQKENCELMKVLSQETDPSNNN